MIFLSNCASYLYIIALLVKSFYSCQTIIEEIKVAQVWSRALVPGVLRSDLFLVPVQEILIENERKILFYLLSYSFER